MDDPRPWITAMKVKGVDYYSDEGYHRAWSLVVLNPTTCTVVDSKKFHFDSMVGFASYINSAADGLVSKLCILPPFDLSTISLSCTEMLHSDWLTTCLKWMTFTDLLQWLIIHICQLTFLSTHIISLLYMF